MSLTYATYLAEIAGLAKYQSSSDPTFVTAQGGMIDYAEQRCYRDLDLITTVSRDSTGSLTSGNRNFTYPSFFIVPQEINVVTPASSTNPDTATRVALVPIAKEVLDFLYPSSAGQGVPTFFAPLTDQSIIVGPWPDANYTVEVVGTKRPAPISSTNTTTFLSTVLPDLFVAASMIFMAGYQRNFGSQSDDPRMSQSWEMQYTSLLKSAKGEEIRKRFAADDWTSQEQSPIAQPARR